MKVGELRGLDVEELLKKDQDLSEELFKLKFQHAIRPLDNSARLRQLRKDVARVKTIINQKRAGQ